MTTGMDHYWYAEKIHQAVEEVAPGVWDDIKKAGEAKDAQVAVQLMSGAAYRAFPGLDLPTFGAVIELVRASCGYVGNMGIETGVNIALSTSRHCLPALDVLRPAYGIPNAMPEMTLVQPDKTDPPALTPVGEMMNLEQRIGSEAQIVLQRLMELTGRPPYDIISSLLEVQGQRAINDAREKAESIVGFSRSEPF